MDCVVQLSTWHDKRDGVHCVICHFRGQFGMIDVMTVKPLNPKTVRHICGF